MDATLKLWLVIVVVGALNYFSRLSFIAFFARRSVPPLLARALRYVPAAMMTALIVPMILPGPPTVMPALPTPKMLAALVAFVVAWYTHSTLKTLVAGMIALWLLQALAARIG
ncbi:MAG TPA: AzlD domain-containing protein [Casimicrobiaceae bacterium]